MASESSFGSVQYYTKSKRGGRSCTRDLDMYSEVQFSTVQYPEKAVISIQSVSSQMPEFTAKADE